MILAPLTANIAWTLSQQISLNVHNRMPPSVLPSCLIDQPRDATGHIKYHNSSPLLIGHAAPKDMLLQEITAPSESATQLKPDPESPSCTRVCHSNEKQIQTGAVSIGYVPENKAESRSRISL